MPACGLRISFSICAAARSIRIRQLAKTCNGTKRMKECRNYKTKHPLSLGGQRDKSIGVDICKCGANAGNSMFFLPLWETVYRVNGITILFSLNQALGAVAR